MIITNNEEALRCVCSDVLPDEVGDLVSTLENELNHANKLGKNGIGLAAPQIGISKKIAIIRLPNQNLNLVNAKIEKSYDLTRFKEEGCLSFPGRVEDTMRHQEVYVTGNLVYPHDFIATGFLAVVVEHEIDHLYGKIFLDHLAPSLKVIKNASNVKLGPNDPCYCGQIDSLTKKTRKYKKCCGK